MPSAAIRKASERSVGSSFRGGFDKPLKQPPQITKSLQWKPPRITKFIKWEKNVAAVHKPKPPQKINFTK